MKKKDLEKQNIEKILVKYSKSHDAQINGLTAATVIHTIERTSMVNLEIDPEYYSKTMNQIISLYRIKLLLEEKIITPTEENQLMDFYQEYLDLRKDSCEILRSNLMSDANTELEKMKENDIKIQEIELILNSYHILDSINYMDMVRNAFLQQANRNEVKSSFQSYEKMMHQEDIDLDHTLSSLDKHVKQKK